jgi:group I intron endonuclease
MKTGIYCIEKIETGVKYIGLASNMEKRMWESHCECPYVYKSIKQHGKENFIRYPILYCEEWELERYEIECIRIFKSHVSVGGYNLTWGGNAPMRCKKHTDEWKIEKSKNMTGEKNPFYGKQHSPETKERQRIVKLNKRRKKQKNATSEYYGVSKRNTIRYLSPWRAFIWTNDKKHLDIGHYKTEKEAALAYNNYVIEHNLPNPLNVIIEE